MRSRPHSRSPSRRHWQARLPVPTKPAASSVSWYADVSSFCSLLMLRRGDGAFIVIITSRRSLMSAGSSSECSKSICARESQIVISREECARPPPLQRMEARAVLAHHVRVPPGARTPVQESRRPAHLASASSALPLIQWHYGDGEDSDGRM
jgi:hypothetical protein